MTRTLSLVSRSAALASTGRQRAVLAALPLGCDFDDAAQSAGAWPLRPHAIATLQINVGKLCNQTCRHCHVDAGPDRHESMSRETMAFCLRALASTTIPTVDITGGAPELNPHFRWLVEQAAAMGRHVMDRCNLTVLTTAGQADLPEFFARHRVEARASLPHYLPANTDRRAGD